MTARRWTQAELDELDELLAQGKTDGSIARHLKRTAAAVQVRRKLEGIDCVSKRTLSARRAAALMGRPPDTVTHWCQRGFIDATRSVRRGRSQQWLIAEDALMAFLQKPNYWPAWSPERITDAGLREWAMELRAGRGLLTVGQLAKRYCVTTHTVNYWLRQGLLPSIKFTNRYVLECDLAGFVPPYEVWPRGGRGRVFTADEDARLFTLRAGGLTWAEIGRELGRPLTSVHRRYYRLQAAMEEPND